MSEYLILAENVVLKTNRISCINVYDKLSTIAMPAEFKFDLVIMCGPNWSVGEHNLTVKAKGSNGKELIIGNLKVNIPNEKFVYNAYANDLKILMDYSVEDLTIVVYDDDKEIISRTYPVISMLVPQQQGMQEESLSVNNSKESSESSEKKKL